MTNPVLHVPAHKQTRPAAKPGQIVNPPRDVWVHAVQQDRQQDDDDPWLSGDDMMGSSG